MALHDSRRLDFHAISKTRHWSPGSQPFAGADNLLWALDDGWQIAPEVICVRYPHRMVTRSVSVYRFTLHQNHNTLIMPVIDTPYLVRLITEHGLHVTTTSAETPAQRQQRARWSDSLAPDGYRAGSSPLL